MISLLIIIYIHKLQRWIAFEMNRDRLPGERRNMQQAPNRVNRIYHESLLLNNNDDFLLRNHHKESRLLDSPALHHLSSEDGPVNLYSSSSNDKRLSPLKAPVPLLAVMIMCGFAIAEDAPQISMKSLAGQGSQRILDRILLNFLHNFPVWRAAAVVSAN
jgi:hypothetical protein